MNTMKDILNKIMEEYPTDRFKGLSEFYIEKNRMGFGLFSTLAGETFPNGWIKSIEAGVWEEEGIYGNNFREAFDLKCKHKL